jgi:alpha-glucosidase
LIQRFYLPDYQNQYEFGNAFMVAPFESTGKDYGKIYFPEGTWYDLYNGSQETGKQEKVVPLSLIKLPVYVKGGSIIPYAIAGTVNCHIANRYAYPVCTRL